MRAIVKFQLISFKRFVASLQVAALRWVKANIEAFSGDPRHITIMGQQVQTNDMEMSETHGCYYIMP